MRISGFTFIRNGISLHYPFRESIRSMLPLCDEVVVVVADSTDGTHEAVASIGDERIRIVAHPWDETLRRQGKLLALLTNEALRHITGQWGLYLQSDEVLHERDLEAIRQAAIRYLDDEQTDGLLFSWYHFLGNYNYIAAPGSRGVYPHEVRLIKTGRSIFSFRDAQGFRRRLPDGRAVKLRVRAVDAHIYHYAKVRGPEHEQQRIRMFSRLWHDDDWIERYYRSGESFRYRFAFPLIPFEGTHPAVMHDRIRETNWPFDPRQAQIKVPFKYRMLNSLYRFTGWRPFEFRNYRLIANNT
ncbi:MAG: glycosyltransferase [Chitinophagales bacterium]|nr:glycosyltransferase [Chitinophagales bacterium]MDW8392663.1 glycosyltransferase [Chitinophagales bacterium]